MEPLRTFARESMVPANDCGCGSRLCALAHAEAEARRRRIIEAQEVLFDDTGRPQTRPPQYDMEA